VNAGSSNAAAPAPSTNAPMNAGHAGHLEGADLAKAEQLFATNCAACHLASGKGDPHHRVHGIPDFTVAAWHTGKTDAELVSSIENGREKVMPAFKGKLSDDEVSLLVHYVHGFPERAAPVSSDEAKQPAASAPRPNAGAGPKPAAKPKTAPKPPAGDHGGHEGHPH